MSKWVDLDNIPYVCQDMTVKQLIEKTEIHEDVIGRSEYAKLLKENQELIETCQNCIAADSQSCEELAELHSKIDKAIEEITNLRQQWPNEDYYDCKWEILEILKKNIGE